MKFYDILDYVVLPLPLQGEGWDGDGFLSFTFYVSSTKPIPTLALPLKGRELIAKITLASNLELATLIELHSHVARVLKGLELS